TFARTFRLASAQPLQKARTSLRYAGAYVILRQSLSPLAASDPGRSIRILRGRTSRPWQTSLLRAEPCTRQARDFLRQLPEPRPVSPVTRVNSVSRPSLVRLVGFDPCNGDVGDDHQH